MDEDKQLKFRERNRKCQQMFRKKKQQQKGSDRERILAIVEMKYYHSLVRVCSQVRMN
ncbi:hypothetical protein DPMN_123987 [Dreissena polymorpha]|uniref:BZIP domain-containing protein n=1 Tax=Dreissena polymorpha TaxID=45954 RepID=A0A9D4JVR6_DREPO|nr:hypothetical protein DPMN_123987 [Dreissena polymorpha]